MTILCRFNEDNPDFQHLSIMQNWLQVNCPEFIETIHSYHWTICLGCYAEKAP